MQAALGRAFEDLEIPFVSLALESLCIQFLYVHNSFISQKHKFKSHSPHNVTYQDFEKKVKIENDVYSFKKGNVEEIKY